ncbi:tannase/feruloyl esterase family alpha/beta hydrolase [Phenylobacterium hankyongense]|uniref:Tannase/feruloyl esterase family alpha/beta hydrolase n=1 Tax=Phenylobacterium hankyongense TaxID=1813876 RepID=A0A328AUV2_9CAUL|nr:tannase/feruloyl esterase family alpha/beta hydrolase [Phenylobacterium hankyongense]RAK58942.1 tannase/feruloyl esterase family alpha/beta hydrolase [Phenylobacterium hankyongense]
MVIAGALLAAVMAGGAAPADCTALAQRAVSGAQVLSAAAVTGRADAPAFCRVVLESRPTAASRIGAEVWLPLKGWTGRYVQLGTGGFAGTFPDAGMAAEVRRGNAVAVTDTGHKGADGFDARWALGASERVIDYGYRSLKVSAVAAKALVAAFYGATPRHSYFIGCSNGGRQALMAAQRYPEDWDGILAGSPALRWTDQLSSFARIQHALRSTPGAMIPAAKLPAIQKAATAACHDGGGCAFDPERLGCAGPETDACLTAAQMRALRLILRDFSATTAAVPGGWDQWIVNPDRQAQSQLTFAEQFFGAVVLGRPDWRVEDLTPEDLARARKLSPVLDATNTDLGRFRRRGGKLVIYVGGADPVISPRAVIDYYQRLGRQDFARLFVIGGMLHCQGGLEPNAFGQAPVAPALRPDARHDVRLALERWVEEGRAPERITAVKYVDDDPSKGVAATRTVKAYPTRRSPPAGGRKPQDAA